MSVIYIYSLLDPRDGSHRYVGKTTQSLVQRLIDHKQVGRRGGRLPVNRWAKKVDSVFPGAAINLLESVEAGGDWVSRERHWIKTLRDSGSRLLNLTDGGEGLAGHKLSEEHKARISASLKRGKTHSCHVCRANFHRKPKDAKSARVFCSRLCANKYNKGGFRDV